MNKQPVSYMQTDPRWSNVDYSAKGESTTIGKSGCGPTCMAMVIATWADQTVTPVETCAWALRKGYKAVNQGTYYSYFTPQGAVYGLEVEQINWSNLRNLSASAAAPYHATALEAAQRGDLVIACMGKGLWTSSGHFILLWDVQGDTAYINDPASTRTERTRGSWARLKREVKYYFICRRPADTDKEDDDMDITKLTKKDLVQLAAMMQEATAEEEPNDWSKDAREWAEKEGIIKGDEQGRKAYKSFVTREQLATIVQRLHG